MNSPRQHTVRWNGRAATMVVTDPQDWIERHWTEGRFYEPATLAVVERYANAFKATGRPSLFVDIGAHRGNHTVFALAVAGFDYALCFEPSTLNADALEANLTANNLHGLAEACRYACGANAEAQGAAIRTTVEANSGAWGFRASGMPTGETTTLEPPSMWLRKIEQVRLERRVPPANVLIKCDVEGMESDLVPLLCERFDVPVIAGDPVKADGVRCIEVLQHGHGVYVNANQEVAP